MNPINDFPCGKIQRRQFLADCGLGFTGLALGAMLQQEGRGAEAAPPIGQPHFAPKAKSVIWFFMTGGTSHVESFDPKPALNRYAGLTIDESPYKSAVLDSPFYRQNVRDFAGTPRALMAKLYPLQIGYRKRGESGIEVSDWWPHVGSCIDDIAVVRSMWTTDNDHAAQLQFHTGRHIFDGFYFDRILGALRIGKHQRELAAIRGHGLAAGRLLRRRRGSRWQLPWPGTRRCPHDARSE